MTSAEERVAAKLSDESRQSFAEFLADNKNNPHLPKLIGFLNVDAIDVRAMLEYGLRKLKRGETDMPLSAYFFLISEIEQLSSQVRDFALDVSVYCEGAHEYSQSYKAFDAAREYKKIEPLLRGGSGSPQVR